MTYRTGLKTARSVGMLSPWHHPALAIVAALSVAGAEVCRCKLTLGLTALPPGPQWKPGHARSKNSTHTSYLSSIQSPKLKHCNLLHTHHHTAELCKSVQSMCAARDKRGLAKNHTHFPTPFVKMAKRKGRSREFIDDSDDPEDTGVSRLLLPHLCVTPLPSGEGQEEGQKGES